MSGDAGRHSRLRARQPTKVACASSTGRWGDNSVDALGYDDGNPSLMEFIVRVDDGAVLSIVQTNEPGFRKGDRVIILRGDQTRIARPGCMAPVPFGYCCGGSWDAGSYADDARGA